jgi:hypothetical protein
MTSFLNSTEDFLKTEDDESVTRSALDACPDPSSLLK